MQRRLAETIDLIGMRVQERSSRLAVRTSWPDDDELGAVREGSWSPPPQDDPGKPAEVIRRPLTAWLAAADETFQFDSSPPFAREHDRSVRGRLYLPTGDARGAVLLAPMAFTGSFRFVDRTYDRVGRAFANAGLVAARLELPLHESRSPAGESSGRAMYQGDHFTFVRSVAQGVRDAQGAAGWLSAEFGPVGYWGMSLGAAIGALAFSHNDLWSFGVLVALPLFPHPALQSPVIRQLCAHLTESGVPDSELAAVLDCLAPADLPALGEDRILLQAGRWDRLAVAEGVTQLAERWGCGVEWVNSGHITLPLGRRWLQNGVDFASRQLG